MMQQDVFINYETDYDPGQVELTTPHFDDELTIASARPVVLLDDITDERKRKGWLIAGAFAISLLLGAGSALLAIRMKRQIAQPVPAEAIVDEQQGEPFEMQGGELTAVATELETNEDEKLENSAEDIEDPPIRAAATVPSSSKSPRKPAKRVAQHSSRGSQTLQTPVTNRQNPTPILVEQWQERRQRRALRRDRRDRRVQRSQDLFRIDQIFEGSRRPS